MLIEAKRLFFQVASEASLLTTHQNHIVIFQSLSRVRLFATPWTVARQASLSITNSQSLPKLMSIESVMPSNHLILCCPLFLLPSIFPSVRVFPMGQLFASGQSIGASASASVLLLGEAHWLKPPTLARHHSNHLHELFYDRRSW